MIKLKCLSVLALALAASAAQGQEMWNFGQVVQTALANHPLILGKRSAQAATRSEREGAEWQRYPTFTAEASSQNSGTNGTLYGSNGASTLLRLDQPLWSAGRISAGIDAAGLRVDAAGAALDEARLEIGLRAAAAATETIRQQLRLQHASRGVKRHQELLEMMRRRVAQEVSPVADEKLTTARLFAATNDVSLAKQDLSNALSQVSQLVGKPVLAIDIDGMESLEPSAMSLPNIDIAVRQAVAYSPQLRRLKLEEESAKVDIVNKQSAYMPQLLLRLERSSVGDNTDHRGSLVLMAQPGAGLSARSGVEAAVARMETARLAHESAVRDLTERVNQDWNAWAFAQERMENADQARTISSEVSESYARQFTTGRKTWIDVLNAVREATQAELAASDTQAQVIAADLRLRAQTGTLLRATETKQ